MPNPEHAEKNEETQSRTPIGQALAEFYRRRKRLSSNFPKFPLSKRNLLGKIGTCALRLLALSPEGFTLSFEEEPAPSNGLRRFCEPKRWKAAPIAAKLVRPEGAPPFNRCELEVFS